MLLSVIKRGEKCGCFSQSVYSTGGEKKAKNKHLSKSAPPSVCFLWHIKGREKKGAERVSCKTRLFFNQPTSARHMRRLQVRPWRFAPNGSRVQGVCAKKSVWRGGVIQFPWLIFSFSFLHHRRPRVKSSGFDPLRPNSAYPSPPAP